MVVALCGILLSYGALIVVNLVVQQQNCRNQKVTFPKRGGSCLAREMRKLLPS